MGNNKPTKAASLTASLLARKGEAVPAASATAYTDPGLAWGAPSHDPQTADPRDPASAHHTPKSLAEVQPDEAIRPRVMAPPPVQAQARTTVQAQAQVQVPTPTPAAPNPAPQPPAPSAPKAQVLTKPTPPITPAPMPTTPAAPVESEIRTMAAAPSALSHKTTRARSVISKSALDRVAVTLRLDDERYLRLKIFSARSKRTNQHILQAALDTYLDQQSLDGNACPCMAKVDRKLKN